MAIYRELVPLKNQMDLILEFIANKTAVLNLKFYIEKCHFS